MRSILLIGLILSLAACNMDEASEVFIRNSNAYPISLTLTTGPVSQKFGPLEPGAEHTEYYIFNDIDFHEGKYQIEIENLNDGTVEKFEHGQYYNGDLGNFISIENNGKDLAIQVDF